MRMSLSVILLFGICPVLFPVACQDGANGGVSTITATASPASTVATSPEAAVAPIYIALGDSLAEGVGASDPSSTACSHEPRA
jgi:hypothetical protein